MPIQRTFELIPTTLINPTGYKPPMTSKQVKREYQKANRLRRIPINEQRRLDLEEIARQKIEFEREKITLRNKINREKKAAKALAEKEERKRAGLPEPNRLVRASQPPISKFVKPLLTRKKRDWQTMNGVNGDSSEIEREKIPESKDMPEPPIKRTVMDSDSEDEFGDFPSCTQIEKIASSIDCMYEKASVHPVPDVKNLKDPVFQSRESLENFPLENRAIQISEILVEPTPVKLQSNPTKGISGPEIVKPQNQRDYNQAVDLPLESFNSSQTLSSQTTIDNCDWFSDESDLTQAKDLPQNQLNLSQNVNDIGIIAKKKKSSISSDNFHSSVVFPSENDPGYSLSSLKPEMEQLLDDIDDFEFPSNTQIMMEISSPCIIRHERDSDGHYLESKNENSTIQSISTNIKSPTSTCLDISNSSNPHFESSIKEQTDTFDYLVCTHDLKILSQKSHMAERLVEVPNQAPTRGRFFEEKEDDLLQAAIYESQMMMRRKIENAKSETKLSSASAFELQYASVHVHKIPDPSQNLATSGFPESFQTHSVVREEEPRTIAISKEKFRQCNVSRYSSPGSDYGGDEFEGEDWEELTALC